MTLMPALHYAVSSIVHDYGACILKLSLVQNMNCIVLSAKLIVNTILDLVGFMTYKISKVEHI